MDDLGPERRLAVRSGRMNMAEEMSQDSRVGKARRGRRQLRLRTDGREQFLRPGPKVDFTACDGVQRLVEQGRARQGCEVQGRGNVGEYDGGGCGLAAHPAGMGVEMFSRVFAGEEIRRR